jgi:hypothetical protein
MDESGGRPTRDDGQRLPIETMDTGRSRTSTMRNRARDARAQLTAVSTSFAARPNVGYIGR